MWQELHFVDYVKTGEMSSVDGKDHILRPTIILHKLKLSHDF